MATLLQQSTYRVLKVSGSLKSFYDDIVYWELASGGNKFFVTFMEGQYGIPNRRQESIGTSEISFPRTKVGETQKSKLGLRKGNRISVVPKTFMVDSETGSGTIDFPNQHNYDGFIPITELKGTRYFQTTLTGSKFIENTYTYNLFDESGGSGNPGLITETRTVKAAYFYPFSSHQLSVLREEPTVIINLQKESELFNGVGEKGFVIVPDTTHQKVKDNLEYYLEKAGLIEKTTITKAPPRGK